MKEIEAEPGQHIKQVAERLAEAARTEDVFTTFNGLCLTATKGSSPESILAEYDRLCDLQQQEYELPENVEKRRQKQEHLDAEKRQQFDEFVAVLSTGDEKTLRELRVPFPSDADDLIRVYAALSERPHDYGTCVYAMSIVAETAFNLMSSKLGCTGFQAGCADFDFIKRTRDIKGPFALIDADKMLYPQYDLRADVEKYLEGWKEWAAAEAQKKISHIGLDGMNPSPSVRKHWENLAKLSPTVH